MKSNTLAAMCIGRVLLMIPICALVCPSLSKCEEPAPPAFEAPPLVLAPGEQRILRAPGLLRYSAAGGAIRSHSTQDSLLIKAIRPGVSDLVIWRTGSPVEHRMVRVEKEFQQELKAPLEKALGRLEETEILYSGSGVILRGTVRDEAELARVSALARGYPKEVSNETVPADALLERGQERLNRWLRGSEYQAGLRVERHDSELWIRGSIDRPSEIQSLENRLSGLYPAVRLEIEALPDSSPTIHFQVFLLELRKSKFSSLGLGWPATQEGAFRVTTGAIQNLVQLDLALQALSGSGSARVLSTPELVVRAPGEAELFAGGELPIQTQGRFYSNVTWKSYGLTLKLKVTGSAGDRIRLEIFTEVSHLDSTIAIDKLPGVQANRMKTQVDARYGTPLFLSGLLQQGLREQAKGLPLLRQLPILGSLFGSEDFLNERSELVAILLPSATPPPAPMKRVLPEPEPSPAPVTGIARAATRPLSAANFPSPFRHRVREISFPRLALRAAKHRVGR